jgi:hypothetical protein
MRIKVEQRHIDRGRPCCTMACPIALAGTEAGLRNPTVSRYSLMQCGRLESRVRLPDAAIVFISKFDLRKPVEPFEFDIDTEPL